VSGCATARNAAYLALAAKGYVTCYSVMVPCPWLREIAEAAAADPALDLGIHLTLTSEWAGYRWAPISTVSRASPWSATGTSGGCGSIRPSPGRPAA
jgi:predicted glycoside hydrolase/deacetylase ChbG (UPF0249 family)